MRFSACHTTSGSWKVCLLGARNLAGASCLRKAETPETKHPAPHAETERGSPSGGCPGVALRVCAWGEEASSAYRRVKRYSWFSAAGARPKGWALNALNNSHHAITRSAWTESWSMATKVSSKDSWSIVSLGLGLCRTTTVPATREQPRLT